MTKKSEASLITNKTNIRYLSGFTGSSGFMLLTGRKKYLFTDFRYIERAKNTIKKSIEIIDITKLWRSPEELKKNWQKILKKHKISTLGVEEADLTVKAYRNFKKISRIKNAKIKFTDISGEIEKTREIKTGPEIKYIKKSQEINEKTFLKIKKIIQNSLKTGKKITEMDIARKIKEIGYEFGAVDIAFDPIVAINEHSSSPHHLPDKTVLKKGDMILIDMGMKYMGYSSDMTRIIFTKKPTPEQNKIYNLVLNAQKEAIKKIKAGITGKKADEYSRKIINDAGYEENYQHAGGHGLGLDIHEAPSLSENYKKRLKENSIITVEPGIYLEGKFGIRIEDMILVKKNGNINLTKIKKEL